MNTWSPHAAAFRRIGSEKLFEEAVHSVQRGVLEMYATGIPGESLELDIAELLTWPVVAKVEFRAGAGPFVGRRRRLGRKGRKKWPHRGCWRYD